MSNKEGYPTNGELQNQLSIIGRNIFVSAIERGVAQGIPDWLLGKTLGSVALTYTNEIEVPSFVDKNNTDLVIRERLKLRLASQEDAIRIHNQHPRWKNDDVLFDKIFASALFFEDTVVEDAASFRHISPETIITHYEAQSINGKPVANTSTVKSKLDKQTLYQSIAMAKESESYTESEDYTKNFFLRLSEFEQGYRDSRPNMHHEWLLPFGYNVNLSGNEPQEYLQKYINDFLKPGLANAKKTLKEVKVSGLGKNEIIKWEEIINERERALEKAQTALLIKITPLD